MLTKEQKQQLSDIVEELGKTLDITKEQYDAAVKSYKYVGEWLSKEDSPLATYSPEILPQGSFLLQTMIRPINEEDDLDIDIVCKLDTLFPSTTKTLALILAKNAENKVIKNIAFILKNRLNNCIDYKNIQKKPNF